LKKLHYGGTASIFMAEVTRVDLRWVGRGWTVWKWEVSRKEGGSGVRDTREKELNSLFRALIRRAVVS
jgi:hypothetical protein